MSNDTFINLHLDLINLDLIVDTGDRFECHFYGPDDDYPASSLQMILFTL